MAGEQSQKERRLERVVGLFIVASFLGFLALVTFAASGSDLFSAKNHYRLELDHGTGLNPGTDVTIAGMRVGYVRKVRLTEARKVELWLTVEQEYASFIREDSVGRVTMTLTGKNVFIDGGSEKSPLLASGGSLVSGNHFDLLIALERMNLVATLEQIQTILEDLTVLAKELQIGDGRLPDVLDAVLAIIEDLHQGKGSIGRLLKDDAMVDKLNGSLDQVGEMTTNVISASESLSATSAVLDRVAGSVDGSIKSSAGSIDESTGYLKSTSQDVNTSAKEMQVTMGKLNESLKELEKTLKAIQGMPLVRGQVKKMDEP